MRRYVIFSRITACQSDFNIDCLCVTCNASLKSSPMKKIGFHKKTKVWAIKFEKKQKVVVLKLKLFSEQEKM